ncbi:hypothetical protein B0T14DRAFT_561479 [Immersiella caudata]|uniref:Glucose-methanol-choline oxidoreductase C-terminal domain-containing protein n=1 Tax=Immersiella caudata TaxID=314043 RepID=A0AA39XH73_9PEZI|nr:hypothetical protein B0T14DRAFT_561479 [Immersiella caudata]
MTSDSSIVDAIRLLANSTGTRYLPDSYEACLVVGYRTQLETLADLQPSPEHQVPESREHIEYRALPNPLDLEINLALVRYFRCMFNTPTLQALGPLQTQPGLAVCDDEEKLKTWIRETIWMSCMHGCSTAVMMPKAKGGVVGLELKVHGASGHRVVDECFAYYSERLFDELRISSFGTGARYIMSNGHHDHGLEPSLMNLFSGREAVYVQMRPSTICPFPSVELDPRVFPPFSSASVYVHLYNEAHRAFRSG